MSEEQKDSVEDLDVPENESDDVKGGLLVPAVQKVREATAGRHGAAPAGGHGGEIQIDSVSWPTTR